MGDRIRSPGKVLLERLHRGKGLDMVVEHVSARG